MIKYNKTKYKLIASVTLFFVVMIITGLFLSEGIRKREVISEHIKMHSQIPAHALMAHSFFNSAADIIEGVSEGGEEVSLTDARSQYDEYIVSFDEARDDLDNLYLLHDELVHDLLDGTTINQEHEDNRRMLMETSALLKKEQNLIQEMVESFFLLMQSGEKENARKVFEDEIDPLLDDEEALSVELFKLHEWENQFHTVGLSQTQNKVMRFILVMSLSIAFFVIAGTFLLVYFVLTPLSEYALAMESILQDGLSGRIKMKKSGTEVGRLVGKFNEMMDKIDSSHEKMQEANERLEREKLSLAESEKRFRDLTYLSPDCIKIIGMDGLIKYMSPGGLKEHSFKSLDEAIGWNFIESVVDEQKDEAMAILENCLIGGESAVFEVNHKHGTADREWCSLSMIPIKDDNGNITGAMAISRDISDLKENMKVLEGEVRETEEARMAMANILEDFNEEKRNLAKEKAKDEALLSSIGEGVIATDKEGTIIFINQAAESLIGYSSKDGMDAIGKSMAKDVLIAQDKNEKDIYIEDRPISRVLKGGKKNTEILYYFKKNGDKFPAFVTTTPVKINDEVVGAVNVFRDITRETEIDKTKTEFVSLASHQLRTPLTAINWYLEMVMNGDAGSVNKAQREYLEEAYHGSQRMVELVNSLLNVSRLDLGTFAIEPKPTNIVDLMNEELKELGFQIEGKKMKVSTKYDKDIPIMNIDPNLMRIVIQNFLTNSIKYSPDEGKIKIIFRKMKNDLLMEFSDTGYGIPKGQQDKLFTKLFRADNIREKEATGTGLGMYIVKQIIDQSGGRIWFESVEDKGTTFYASIPLSGMEKKEGAKGLSA